jgi:apolipoprotein N-acyltransferase
MVSNDKRMPVSAVCLATAASGAAWWFGSGLAPLAFLAWLAPLPLLWIAPRLHWLAAALAALCAGACAGLNQWHYLHGVIGLPAVVGVLVAAAPALTFSLCLLLYRRLFLMRRFASAALAFPATWVALDYVSALASPHGTFGSLAYSQIDVLPVLQLASVTGIWGLSFLLLFAPAAAAIALSRDAAVRSRASVGAAALLLVAITAGFGAVRLREPALEHVRIGLASLAAPVRPALDSPEGAALLQRYLGIVDALAAQGAQTVVLPESSFRTEQGTVPALAASAARHGITIDIGIAAKDASGIERNMAWAFGPASTAPVAYAKHHLIPGFESQYRAGTDYALLGATHTGLAVCKDMDFHDTGRAYAARNANLLLVPAWDFGVDGTMHARMAVMRGVESGFALARAARRGKLTLADDRGRIVAEANDESGAAQLVGDLPLHRSATLYALWGDWFAWLDMALLSFVLLRLRHS